MSVILCGTIVEKVGELERFCIDEAKYVIPLMDDAEVQVIDGIALCEEHSTRFDEGHSLIVQTRKKADRLLIRIDLNIEQEDSILPESITQGE